MSKKKGEQMSFNLSSVRGKQKLPTKKQLTVRLSPEVIDHFKEDGRGWQTRMNNVLREHVYKEKKRQARLAKSADKTSH